MDIDYSPLEKALASLERAIKRSSADTSDDELRDAVIQRFEYTYELCWKMLKRRIMNDHPNPAELDSWSYKQLIREGARRGFIENPERWFVYREKRNITSHTYNASKAKEVYLSALEFFDAAVSLLKAISK